MKDNHEFESTGKFVSRGDMKSAARAFLLVATGILTGGIFVGLLFNGLSPLLLAITAVLNIVCYVSFLRLTAETQSLKLPILLGLAVAMGLGIALLQGEFSKAVFPTLLQSAAILPLTYVMVALAVFSVVCATYFWYSERSSSAGRGVADAPLAEMHSSLLPPEQGRSYAPPTPAAVADVSSGNQESMRRSDDNAQQTSSSEQPQQGGQP